MVFLATFLYAIGCVGNVLVPKGIDSGESDTLIRSLIINLLLLGAFAIQHSVMARQGFKTWWTKIVPKPVEHAEHVFYEAGRSPSGYL